MGGDGGNGDSGARPSTTHTLTGMSYGDSIVCTIGAGGAEGKGGGGGSGGGGTLGTGGANGNDGTSGSNGQITISVLAGS